MAIPATRMTSGGGQEPNQPAFEGDAAERRARDNRCEADAGDRERKARAEGEDQQQTEGDPVQRDRREQDHERGGAGKEAARDAYCEERAEAGALLAVVVVMVVLPAVPPAGAQHRRADADHEQARDEVQPRVEPVGDDELRESERHQAEAEDADRVRDRHDQPEQRGVARGAALADEVGGDDRLAVAGRKRMRGAPEERGGERGEDHEQAQMRLADERGEAGVRDPVRRLQAGSVRERGSDVGAGARGELSGRRCHIERALEHVLRVSPELVAAARRARPDHDLLPADPVGVVRVAVMEPCRPGEPRPGQYHLDPRRPEPARARWVGERLPERDESCRPPRHRQVGVGGDPPRVGPGVDVACLEGRDLGHVQDVEHVNAVARDLDAAEPIDREVAEWVRGCRRRREQRGRHCEQKDEALHRSSLVATGAHSTEKRGFSASARPSQLLAAAR